jgi:hypothetical protein
VAILKQWLLSDEHFAHPYPTQRDLVSPSPVLSVRPRHPARPPAPVDTGDPIGRMLCALFVIRWTRRESTPDAYPRLCFPGDAVVQKQLMAATGIDKQQLKNWFTNARRRIWKPMMRRKSSGYALGTDGRGSHHVWLISRARWRLSVSKRGVFRGMSWRWHKARVVDLVCGRGCVLVSDGGGGEAAGGAHAAARPLPPPLPRAHGHGPPAAAGELAGRTSVMRGSMMMMMMMMVMMATAGTREMIP